MVYVYLSQLSVSNRLMYNWQHKDWPRFTYDLKLVEADLFLFAERLGRIVGINRTMAEGMQLDVAIAAMTEEAIKTSEIEGEFLHREDVVSSIRNNLGLNPSKVEVRDQRATGISELMLEVSKTFDEPMTNETLFGWHGMLMRGNTAIGVGKWRTHTDPMQIVSGAIGREKIHFEAPPSSSVPTEMAQFIAWFNDSAPNGNNPIVHTPERAAIAHLYFESVHPFEDGNGRIGRAISEKTISQGVGSALPISLSKVIEANKKLYYAQLENAQRSMDVTEWVCYFVRTVLESLRQSEEMTLFILKKAKFFDEHRHQLNDRQARVVKRMLEEGSEGFEGGMNARKYVGIAKTSKATATRDLQDLSEKKILIPIGAGRSARYEIDL
jgi:Fic family protein